LWYGESTYDDTNKVIIHSKKQNVSFQIVRSQLLDMYDNEFILLYYNACSSWP